MTKNGGKSFNWHSGSELPSYKEIPTLYEYMPLESKYIGTLKAKSLFVSNPKSFNDPFDCWAHIDTASVSSEELAIILTRLSKIHKGIASPEDIVKIILNYERNRGSIPLIDTLGDGFRAVAETLGVLCFSSEWDSFLMWSHYAKSHTGICIGYKREGLKIEGGSEKALPIQYKPAIIDLRHVYTAQGGSISDEAAIAFLHTKNKDWEYEREWRLITEKEYSGKRMEWDDCGAQIVEVIFGLKTPQLEIDNFIRLLRELELKVNCVLLAYNPKENKIFRDKEFSSYRI